MRMNTDPLISTRVAVTRMIVLSLVVGIAVGAGIVGYVQHNGIFAGVGIPTVAYVGIGTLVLSILVQPLLMRAIAASGRRRLDPSDPMLAPWLDLFAVKTIIGCALLEGGAFLCCIGALLHGEPLALAGAALGALAILALHFPSETKAENFISEQRELAISERTSG